MSDDGLIETYDDITFQKRPVRNIMEMIKKINLSEAVAERLLSLISEGELQAGGRLPSEPVLCKMLGVSRTALREGIKALAGIDVLAVFPGRGTFVKENPGVIVKEKALKVALQRESIEDIYEVRSVLDAGIARCAALRADKEDVKALRRALKKMEKSLRSKPVDFQSATEADEEFHLALCRAAHNRLLENIAQPVINHVVLRNWKQMNPSLENVRAGLEGHRMILQGIEKRDVGMALDAVERHLKMAFASVYKQGWGHEETDRDR